jgi:replicative DNA helicase
LTTDDIVSQVKREARSAQGIDLVVVDHLHLLNDQISRGTTQADHIGSMTRRLKDLAREIHCPILLIAQLNRDSERDQQREPSMVDLRGSGSIEQDADKIILLHRPSFYIEREVSGWERPSPGLPTGGQKYQRAFQKFGKSVNVVMQAIVAKNRQGRTGGVLLYYDTATSVITDLVIQNQIRRQASQEVAAR